LVDSAYLAGSSQGLFEVRASANLHTVVARLGPFNLDKKAPVAAITMPEEGLVFSSGESIILSGNGFDFEDGPLAEERLAWSSNLDGNLGTGESLMLDTLAPGLHTITLLISDSDGQTAQDQIQVEIAPSGATAATRQIDQAGTYEFGATGAVIDVLSTGGCLESISVRRSENRHPNATDQISEDRYWQISQTGCQINDSNAGFVVNLTLPTDETPDANRLLCRWADEAWDCASHSFDADAGTVTRTGIVQFSDWTIGQRPIVLMLPIVGKTAAPAPPSRPDLVVASMGLGDSGLQVVIKNQGAEPVVDGFWVDLYINPTAAPTMVNQLWQSLGTQGLVWGVESSALPLQPGASLVLTIGDGTFYPELSNFAGSLPAGAPIYAQVDSWNDATSYGAVYESHEVAGQSYNNITHIILTAPLRFDMPLNLFAQGQPVGLPIRLRNNP
jgi:hypothetical protein